MRKNLNTFLLLVAILLLAYIAFLKPTSPRFVTFQTAPFILDTNTGRVCEGRIPSEHVINKQKTKINELVAGFKNIDPSTLPSTWQAINPHVAMAEQELESLLHPSKYPLCSEF